MHLLIPAAGMGRRMGSDRNKLLLTLEKRPVIAWTLLAAEAAPSIDWIGIICQSQDLPVLSPLPAALGLHTPVTFIPGGDTRQASVHNGLQALPDAVEQVLIHDGARCLASADLFDRCAGALATCLGLIAAVPVKDTIKVVGANHQVQSTPDRATLWAAQTPQGFSVPHLRAAHHQGIAKNWAVTDDAVLFEKVGLPVTIVPGEETNLKVTTPEDLAIAAMILQRRSGAYRVGPG